MTKEDMVDDVEATKGEDKAKVTIRQDYIASCVGKKVIQCIVVL